MSTLPAIHARGTAVRMDIRVSPRASKNAIDGVRDGRLVVKVTAPPVDAAANEAVVALLADEFDIPKRQITIVMGATGRSKTVELAGVTADAIRARLSDI
ncbi:MAG: DUF167 domain-containing protein, partial [Acidobacteriota bacterium]